MGRDPSKPSAQTEGYGDNSDNLGNLPYGSIDAVITSPPYEEAMGKKHHSPRSDKLSAEKKMGSFYTDKVDCVITSPPYEDSFGASRQGKVNREQTNQLQMEKSLGYPYTSQQTNNIGNLKGQSYLSAMLEVYKGCCRVLKPQGLMCLVTKNFIRNKTEIRLDLDTIKLCEQAGFELIERHYRKLTSQSFWRTIYQKKYPDAPVLDQEDILVFRK